MSDKTTKLVEEIFSFLKKEDPYQLDWILKLMKEKHNDFFEHFSKSKKNIFFDKLFDTFKQTSVKSSAPFTILAEKEEFNEKKKEILIKKKEYKKHIKEILENQEISNEEKEFLKFLYENLK